MSNSLKMLPTITVGTTAVAVDQRSQGSAAGTMGIHKYASVSLQADPANTGKIFVGDNSGNLSTTTYVRVLNAGDWFSVAGSAVDASKMFVLGSAAGQVVHVGAS
jgi:hypothetical protein